MDCAISRQDFEKTIDNVRKVYDYHDKLNAFYRQNGVDGYIIQPDCQAMVIRLLHIMFGEADKGNVIEWFCYDLEFGTKWDDKTLTLKDIYGNPIKMQTAGELYDYLCSRMDNDEDQGGDVQSASTA